MKSLYSCFDMRIEKKMSKEVKEVDRASSDEIANNLKAKWFWKMGSPVSWFTPPGTVDDEAKARVDIRAAITEQELHMLFSHSLLFVRSFSCVPIKIWVGLLSWSFRPT